MEYSDVAVIGGGLLGCFAARNLRRWDLSTALIEWKNDVCTGISRANTAIVYTGYDHKPGTLKAEMTVRAGRRFGSLCSELEVPFSRCGSLLLCTGERGLSVLRKKYSDGTANGVSDLKIISGDEARAMESGLSPDIRGALFAPGTGTVNPWKLCFAAYENVLGNGARAFLDSKVCAIRRDGGYYIIETDRGEHRARAVVNCAGIYAADIQKLIYPCDAIIRASAGDYLVLDKNTGHRPSRILEYEPENGGKGINIVPTTEKTLLVGATERENTVSFATDRRGIDSLKEKMREIMPGLDGSDIIRSFAALRPNPEYPDGRSIKSFLTEHPGPGFYSFIGIKTPGMTCADELGAYVAEKIAEELGAGLNGDFDPRRRGIPCIHDMSVGERREAALADPDALEVVCMCEDVTLKEIKEAVRRGAVTPDGVKRRTGAMLGRCQGARCRLRTEEIIEQSRGGDSGEM